MVVLLLDYLDLVVLVPWIWFRLFRIAFAFRGLVGFYLLDVSVGLCFNVFVLFVVF